MRTSIVNDYLAQPLASRLARRKADGERNFRLYAAAYGGIFTREGMVNPETVESIQPRNVRPCHKIARIRHTGWYCDNDQQETAHGVVGLLPHGRFIPGIQDPWGNPPVWGRESFDCETAAAYRADGMTEKWAEECREGDAQFRAEQGIEDNLRELSTLRASICELVQSLKGLSLPDPVCRAVKAQLASALREKRKLWAEIHSFRESHWNAVRS